MLAVLLEVLVIVAILMIVSVLLRSILMHLLGTRSKLVWSTIATHGHCFRLVKLRLREARGTHFVQVVAEGTEAQHTEDLDSYQDSFRT